MKDCLIIGNKNAVTTKYVFPLLKDRVLKTGYTVPMNYTQPEWCETKFLNGLTRWFTTLPVEKKTLTLTSTYDPDKYPKYDNYDAIEVSKTTDIPMDYNGIMGVPISFLMFHCPEQFELIEMCASHGKTPKGIANESCYLNGKWVYARILIRKRTA